MANGSEATMQEPRIRQWNPTMAEYHTGASVSSGFLGCYRAEGLAAALAGRGYDPVTTKKEWAHGAIVHARLSNDPTVNVGIVLNETSRNSKRWKECLDAARRSHVFPNEQASKILDWSQDVRMSVDDDQRPIDILVLPADRDNCDAAMRSLYDGGTPAKREILAAAREWESWPEVSHLWEPPDAPGVLCRIREDLLARTPGGQWAAVQAKTTATPITGRAWWPFWRHHYMASAALYRQGLRDLLQGEPFVQTVAVCRLLPPYPWAFWQIGPELGAELDALWYNELIPSLRQLQSDLARGYSDEEAGLFAKEM